MDENTTKHIKILNEKFCNILFEEIRDSVILTTESLKIIKANYPAAMLFGDSEKTVLGRNLDTIFEPESRQRCRKLIKILNIDGETTNIFLDIIDYTGVRREYSTAIRYFSLEETTHGYFLFIMHSNQDHDNRYNHEVDSTVVVKRLLKGFSDSVLLIDSRGCTLDCNLQAEIMFGYSRNELIGRSPQFLAPDATLAKKYIEDSRTGYSSTGFYQEKMLCRKKDGSRFMTFATNISMFNTRGELQYVVAINRDITREEKILDNILRYAEQSKQLLQTLYESVLPLKAVDPSITLKELGFSDRQIAIAAMLQTGEPTKKIADRLNISESSVKSHLTIMYRKLNVLSRVEFVKYLHDHHLRIE